MPDTLPTLADGPSPYPGMVVFFVDHAGAIHFEIIDRITWDREGAWLEWDIDDDDPLVDGRFSRDCFSTFTAADAAVLKPKGKTNA